MPRNKELKEKRNQSILERFRYHRKRNPKWTIFAVIEEVAGDFYLTPVTVSKILKQGNLPNIPDPSTTSKHTKQNNIGV